MVLMFTCHNSLDYDPRYCECALTIAQNPRIDDYFHFGHTLSRWAIWYTAPLSLQGIRSGASLIISLYLKVVELQASWYTVNIQLDGYTSSF